MREALKSILVVEDEPLIAMHLEQVISQYGNCRVRVAESVTKALEILDEEKIAGATLDYNLENETSMPVAERLAAENIPFIFLTGRVGANDLPPPHNTRPVVAKPFQPNEVVAHIATMQ